MVRCVCVCCVLDDVDSVRITIEQQQNRYVFCFDFLAGHFHKSEKPVIICCERMHTRTIRRKKLIFRRRCELFGDDEWACRMCHHRFLWLTLFVSSFQSKIARTQYAFWCSTSVPLNMWCMYKEKPARRFKHKFMFYFSVFASVLCLLPFRFSRSINARNGCLSRDRNRREKKDSRIRDKKNRQKLIRCKNSNSKICFCETQRQKSPSEVTAKEKWNKNESSGRSRATAIYVRLGSVAVRIDGTCMYSMCRRLSCQPNI